MLLSDFKKRIFAKFSHSNIIKMVKGDVCYVDRAIVRTICKYFGRNEGKEEEKQKQNNKILKMFMKN